MEKTFVKFSQKFVGVVFASILLVLSLMLSSCGEDAGLGGSVDTETPTIAISYPPASATIRGTFLLAGTWDDDKSVSEVTATILNTSTKKSYESNVVTVSSNKTWSVKVNNQDASNSSYTNGWQLPDGKYQISVTAKDSAGHKSSPVSRTFEIDNTAPVVVLTSPGSTTNATKYGSSFKVEGTIADEHSISSLAVTIFDKDGNVLDSTDSVPYSETNVATAGGTSISLLKFSTDPKTTAQKRYEKIYGDDRNRGTVPYSCIIHVSDNAKEYVNSTENDNSTDGNKTESFYLYEDVYESLMSSNTGYDLSAADFMNITNKTYVASDDESYGSSSDIIKGSLTLEQLGIVESKLLGDASVIVNTTEKHLLFSLNPAVNPTYTVSGLALEDSPSGTKNQTVTFIVSPGLDGALIKPATIKVWLLNCGALGTAGFDPSKYTEFVSSPASFEGKTGVTLVRDFGAEGYDSTPVSSLTASFKIPEVVANNYYIIAISGLDADQNEFLSDGTFGFIAALSGTPPTVSFTSPVSQSILVDSDEIKFKGAVVTTEVELESVSISIDVSNVEDGEALGTMSASSLDNVVTFTETNYDESTGKYTYTWEAKLSDVIEAKNDYDTYSAKKDSNKIYMYVATVTAEDASGNKNTSSRTVTADTVKPEISINSVTPSVSGYDTTNNVYLNGTIKISGSINEMNLKDAAYTVYVDGNEVENYKDVPITISPFTIEVDTTSLTDNKPFDIIITAHDRAKTAEQAASTISTSLDGSEGNTGTTSINDILSSGQSFHILQETDRPVVSPTGASTSINSVDDIVAAANNPDVLIDNIFTSGGTLNATITDDDGVDSVVVYYRKNDSNAAYTEKLTSSFSKSNNTLTATLPVEYGVYDLKIDVVDSIQELSTSSSSTEFAVAIDDGAPTFSSVTPADGGYYSNKMDIAGTITDKSGEVKLQIVDSDTYSDSSYKNVQTLSATEDGVRFADSVKVPSDSKLYNLKYIATDKYGQSKEYVIKYTVDGEPPSVKEAPKVTYQNDTAVDTSKFISTGSPKITVYVKDNGEGSGIASVEAVSSSGTTKLTVNGTADAAGWLTYIGTLSLADGTNNVTLNIADQAGNTPATPPTVTIKVDTGAPSVSSESVSSSLINKTQFNDSSFEGIKVTANVADSGSGVKYVWLSTTNNSYSSGTPSENAYTAAPYQKELTAAETEASQTENGCNVSITIPKTVLSDGNYTYYLYAMDGSQQSKVSGAVQFTIDKTPPVITVTNLADNGLYTEKNIVENSLEDGTDGIRTAEYEIAGTWTDSVTNPVKLEYSIDSGSSWTEIQATGAATLTMPWSNTITVKESSGNSISFRATDAAGNTGLSSDSTGNYYVTRTGLTFDFSVPTISVTTKPAAQTKAAISISGTIEDKLAINSSDITITASNGSKTVTPAIIENPADKSYDFTLSIPAESDHSYDGNWTVTINAKDKAGRSASAETITTLLDTTAPVITLPDNKFATGKSLSANSDAVYYFNGSDIPTLRVTAIDALVDASVVNSVEYAAVAGHATTDISSVASSALKIDWISMQLEAGNTQNWKASVTGFNSLANGEYTVFVRASDSLANVSYSEAIKVYNDKTLPELGETVDSAHPVTNGSSYDSGSFTLSGTVSDTIKLKTVTLERADSESDESNFTFNETDGTWSLSQTVSGDSSHTYTYNITAVDMAGNENYITNRTVSIDRTPPAVTIETLNKTESNAGTSFSTSEKNCIFKGKITDEGGSGLNTDSLKISYKNSAGIVVASGTVSPDSAGNYTYTFYDVAEGSYTLEVEGKDNAGNSDSKTQTFDVDNQAPVSTLAVSSGILKQITTEASGSTIGVATDVTSSISSANFGDAVTYIADSDFTLSGEVTDNFGFEATSIKLFVNSAETAFTETSPENFAWSRASDKFTWKYTQIAGTEDKTYTYRLKLTDKAGNSETKEFIVKVDTKVPNILSVTSPGSKAIENGTSVELKGNVSDSGAGIMKVSYEITNTTDTTQFTGDAEVDGGNWSKTVSVLSEGTSGLSEGTLSLVVTAYDYLGHSKKSDPVIFYHDKTKPTLRNLSVTTEEAATGWYDTSILGLKVQASDAQSGVASVTYKIGDKSAIALTEGTGVNEGIFTSSNVVCSDGSNTITVVVTDNANNFQTQEITVNVDTVAPVFGNTVRKKGLSSESTNSSNADVTISGTITEALGLAATDGFVITATKKIGSDTTTLDSSEVQALVKAGNLTIVSPVSQTTLSDAKWSFTLKADSDNHSTDGSWVFTITAKDQANHSAKTTANVIIDTKAPAWYEDTDKKFVVGGKTYADTNWYKVKESENLAVSGYFNEIATGSGIKIINYTIRPAGENSTIQGTISPNSATGVSKFAAEITGFTNGATLEFTATDEAGNTSETKGGFVIKIDTAEPELDSTSLAYKVGNDETITSLWNETEQTVSTILSNAEKQLVITGTVKDAAGFSGIDISSISATKGGVIVYDAGSSNGSTTVNFSLLLSTSALGAMPNGVNTINATIKDVAGNSTTVTVATIQIDKLAPTAKINSPANSSRVNKTVTFTGTASDSAGFDYAIVEVAKSSSPSDDSDYTQIASTKKTDGTTDSTVYDADTGVWTVSLDTFTETYTQTSTETPLSVRITAYDKAGNSATDSRTYTIAQDDDRPIVQVTNLAKLSDNQYVLKYGTYAQISGKITDDDSTSEKVVTKLLVAKDTFEETPSDWTEDPSSTTSVKVWTNESYGKVELTVASGDWIYTPATADQSDGEKTMFFYVEDNQGTKFYTKATDSLNRAYWQFKTDSKADTESAVSYKVDGTSPKILAARVVAYSDSEGSSPFATDDSDNAVSEAVGSSAVLGGTKKRYAKLIITASDANGISNLSLKISQDITGVIKTVELSTADTNPGTFTSVPDSSTGITTATWETVIFDTDGFETGEATVAIEATDGSGLSGNGSYNFNIDYTPPTLGTITPNSNNEQMGSVTIAGSASDVGTAGVSEIQYAVPLAESSESITLTYGGRLASGTTASAWTFNLNNNATTGNPSLHTYIEAFKTYSVTQYNDKDLIVEGTVSDLNDIWAVPVLFKVSDTLGNTATYEDYTVRYNPNADMPYTKISYPTEDDYNTNESFVTLSGQIRVSGSVSIEDSSRTIAAVFLQVGKATTTDGATTVDWTQGNAWTVENGISTDGLTVYASADAVKTALNLTSVSNTKTGWWGLEAKGSSSWNITLNKGSAMNPSGDATNDIAIRACAINDSGKFGNWSDTIYIHIDNAAPQMTYSIKQFSTAPSADAIPADSTVLATRDYDADTYLRNPDGNWWIEVVLTDASGINVNDSSVTPSNADTGSLNPVFVERETIDGTSGYKNYNVYIPVSKVSGYSSYNLIVYDNDNGGSHSSRMNFTLNVDNDAPVTADLKDSSGSYDIAMTKLSNSNYVVTFSTIATDTGSGFTRMAYYFKRGDSVELPIPDAQTDENNWKPDSESRLVSSALTTSGDNADLYGVTIEDGTVTVDSSSNTGTFTATGVSSVTSGIIRKGSLIRIGEVYYDITNVSETTVTFSTSGNYTSAPTAGESVSAFFAAAFVVNAGQKESNEGWNSGVQTIGSDDGDGVLEAAEASGTSYNINTSFYSDELDDGKLKIVCVSFDNVGNFASTNTTIMLANNTPRLSKVYLATDLNGDGSFSANEMGSSEEGNFYSALDGSGKGQEIVTLSANSDTTDTGLRMTNKLGMAFEFVNGYETATHVKTDNEGYGKGQGDLGYVLNVGSEALKVPSEGSAIPVETADSFTDSTIKALSGVVLKNELFVSETTSETTYGTYSEWNTDNDVLNYITLTLWDSSNNKQGTKDVIDESKSNEKVTYYTSFGAQYTVLNIPLKMDLVDNIEPIPAISSLGTTYTDSNTTTTLAGHVDLGTTLNTNVFSGSAPSDNVDGFVDAEFDTDDKISGAVVFEGIVTDEQKISGLWLNSSSTLSKAMSSVQVAELSNGVLTTTADAAGSADTWQFSILNTTEEEQFKVAGADEDLPNGGHIVKWRLVLNSAIVTDIAQSDVTFTLTAKDNASTTNPNSKAVARKVDIVPYVTEIVSDSKNDEWTGSGKLYRSRYGEYSVFKGDKLTVKGYNLPGTATASTAEKTGTTYVKVGKNTVLATAGSSSTQFTMTVPEYSGELYVKVNGMVNLNSLNNNNNATNKEVRTTNSYTGEAETYYYDNRYLRVWDIDHSFKDADDNAHKPIMVAAVNGTLFGAWTRMGDGQVIMQRGASNSSTRILQHFDQPAEYVAVGIDKTVDNGDISVLNFNENVGDGAIMVGNGFSNVSNTGGAWGIAVNNSLSEVSNENKGVSITNNPTTWVDSNWFTAGYSLASYAMLRDVSKFSTPRTARKEKNMHYVYYDSKDQSLRYTYVQSGSNSTTYGRNKNFNTKSWVLIDGTINGYDRLHDENGIQGTVNEVGTSTKDNDPDSVTNTGTYDSIYASKNLGVATDYDAVNKKLTYAGLKNALNGTSSTTKYGIAITYTTSDETGNKKIIVLDDVYVDGDYVVLNRALSDNELADLKASYTKKLTIYKGAKNVITSTSAAQSSAAGKFASLDLTSDGAPVVAYYDSTNNQLRVASTAKTDSTAGTASNWVRQIVKYGTNKTAVSGGQHCALKVGSDGTLHIIYRGSDNSLYYISSKSGSAGGTYDFNAPVLIDDNTTGTWGTISLRNGTTPVVAYLNSEESAEGVKVAILRNVDAGAENTSATTTTTSTFDTMIMPLAEGHNVVGENLVCVEANSGLWNTTEAGVSMSNCEAAVSYQSNRLDLSFLKSEQ